MNIKGLKIRVSKEDYICLTDMCKDRPGKPGDYIRNWIQALSTIRFLAVWEQKHNPTFNDAGLRVIETEIGRGRFYLSPKRWVELTNAIGIYSGAGRYAGTYAHFHIAIHFANWFDERFYVEFINEFDRLKRKELSNWSVNKVIDNLSESIYLLEEYNKPKKKE